MSPDAVRFMGDVLFVSGMRLELEYLIDAAWRVDDCTVVLFDPDAEHSNFGQFRNLVALDDRGHRRWVADLPSSRTGDRYYRVQSESPIVVSSVSSFDCEIDPATGRVIQKEFLK